MPLWGANTADSASKPKYLNTLGDFYVKDSCVGANHSSVPAGAAHAGWVQEVTASTSRFNITTAGSGYANGEQLIASNVGTTNATARILTDGSGAILSTYAFQKGTANAANFGTAAYTITKKVSAVAVSGTATGIYVSGAPVLFSGGGGSGAAATIVANSTSISNVVFSSTGTGYTSAPTAAVGQYLANVAISAGGTGYSNTDKVVFSGGAGVFQAAAASIVTNASGGIVNVNLTANVGNNYTSAPTAAVQNSTGGTSGGSGATLAPKLPGTGQTLNVTLGGSSGVVALTADDKTNRVRRETLVAF